MTTAATATASRTLTTTTAAVNTATTIDKNLQTDIHEEDDILELDASKVALVSDTFGKVEMYLRSDSTHGFVRLNAPGLYSFQRPEQPDGDAERSTHNENDDSRLIDSWTKEAVKGINLIRKEDEAVLGVIQRDVATGEIFILMPVELDLLLQPEPDQVVDSLNTTASMITITDSADDEEDSSQTTLTPNPRPSAAEHEVCNFMVPQLSLKFMLTLEVDEPKGVISPEQPETVDA